MPKLSQEQRERIEQWCVALESGKYKQGNGRLFNATKNAYFCLGVACEISGLGEWDLDDNYACGRLLDSLGLSYPLREHYGLRERDPGVYEDGRNILVKTLNDTAGYTFPQIAAAIRRTYLTEGK